MTDEEAIAIIKEKYYVSGSLQLKGFEKEKRDRCIKELKGKGLSIRQIQIKRLTGISRSIILEA